MLVRLPEPFSFELTTERYRAFGRDPATLWQDGRLHRVIAGRERAIAPAPGGVEVVPDGDAAATAEVGTLLGAPFDLDAFAGFATTADPVLAGLVEGLRGLRPSLAPDPFEMLVGAITAQQVSLHAALAIRSRLVERFGERHELAWAFPTRERIAAAGPDELRALGFSTRKAEHTVALARSDLDLAGLATLPDEEVKRELVAQPGLGEWTADWFLARHLGRPDAWPAGDLALRKAVSALYFEGAPLTIDETRAFGERFAGHRNLAAHYLLVGNRVLG
jgi:3-methyladenine DNA glycosylase/8-oxoguanine DNA glycosylase